MGYSLTSDPSFNSVRGSQRGRQTDVSRETTRRLPARLHWTSNSENPKCYPFRCLPNSLKGSGGRQPDVSRESTCPGTRAYAQTSLNQFLENLQV